MTVYRIENSFHFGPFLGPCMAGQQEISDADYCLTMKHDPIHNYEIFGFLEETDLLNCFQNCLEKLHDIGFTLATYAINDKLVRVFNDGTCAFDITNSVMIHNSDIHGNVLKCNNDLSEFKKQSRIFYENSLFWDLKRPNDYQYKKD